MLLGDRLAGDVGASHRGVRWDSARDSCSHPGYWYIVERDQVPATEPVTAVSFTHRATVEASIPTLALQLKIVLMCGAISTTSEIGKPGGSTIWSYWNGTGIRVPGDTFQYSSGTRIFKYSEVRALLPTLVYDRSITCTHCSSIHNSTTSLCMRKSWAFLWYSAVIASVGE